MTGPEGAYVAVLPTRDEVIEHLSWTEDLQRGRWGTDFATEVIEHLEAVAKGREYPHHAEPWSVREDGECTCECRACYREPDFCLCQDCTDRNHDHSQRLTAKAGS